MNTAEALMKVLMTEYVTATQKTETNNKQIYKKHTVNSSILVKGTILSPQAFTNKNV